MATTMKFFLTVLTTLIVSVLYYETASAYEQCSVEYRPVGCYKDRRRHRALTDLMITDRDRSSRRYSGKDIDWLNFDVYIHDLACRCAKKAHEKHYSHFGLQFFGECWAGGYGGVTFAKYGKSKNCANEFYGDCEDPEEGDCIGRGGANFVYELKDEPAGGSGDIPP